MDLPYAAAEVRPWLWGGRHAGTCGHLRFHYRRVEHALQVVTSSDLQLSFSLLCAFIINMSDYAPRKQVCDLIKSSLFFFQLLYDLTEEKFT